MAKKLKPSENATIQGVSVEIHGTPYTLCYTFAALSKAKKALVASGDHTNLFVSFQPGFLDVDKLPALLYAALSTEHPEITPQAAADLIDMQTYETLLAAVYEAYERSKSAPKPAEGDEKNAPAQ